VLIKKVKKLIALNYTYGPYVINMPLQTEKKAGESVTVSEKGEAEKSERIKMERAWFCKWMRGPTKQEM
jgi:hypothetical protein